MLLLYISRILNRFVISLLKIKTIIKICTVKKYFLIRIYLVNEILIQNQWGIDIKNNTNNEYK